jgi:hypothetical protein
MAKQKSYASIVRPRNIVIEERLQELLKGFKTLSKKNIPFPKEWLEEWNILNFELISILKKKEMKLLIEKMSTGDLMLIYRVILKELHKRERSDNKFEDEFKRKNRQLVKSLLKLHT